MKAPIHIRASMLTDARSLLAFLFVAEINMFIEPVGRKLRGTVVDVTELCPFT